MDEIQTVQIKVAKERIIQIVNNYTGLEFFGDLSSFEHKQEGEVDIAVYKHIEELYENKDVVYHSRKNEPVFNLIRSKTNRNNKGTIDVSLFNYFGDNGIDIIIEDKNDKTVDNPIEEATTYANDINLTSNTHCCRVAIGVNPLADVPLKTQVYIGNGKWDDLIINGRQINGFIGEEILKIIYAHPGVSRFSINEDNEDRFTRSEFHNILYELPILFRSISELANNDSLKISFTVAFISLKVILQKQEELGAPVRAEDGRPIYWRESHSGEGMEVILLRNIVEIKSAVDAIAGPRARRDLKEKFEYIFQLTDDLTFNQLLEKIRNTENGNNISEQNSSINKIKKQLDKIPNQRDEIYSFDLFGEVYESLADAKTKKDLGQYFTKRHIIRPLINIFFKQSDLQDIVEDYKSVADIFCGTGGFLTESFRHIREYCKENYTAENEKDISAIANQTIFAYDVFEINASKTKINMTLANDGFSIVEARDSLRTLTTPNIFDFILTNVPYGAGTDESVVKNIENVILDDQDTPEARMNNRVSTFEQNNTTKKLELNAVIKVIQLLKEGGKALIIVPDGLLENTIYRNFREWLLVKCKIESIISLPPFAFAPYTKESTFALIITKRSTRNSGETIRNILDIDDQERIFSYIIDMDGYANSDKQYETDLVDENGIPLHNELISYIDNDGNPHVSKIEETFLSRREDADIHSNQWGEKIDGKKYGYIYVKNDILSSYYNTSNDPEEMTVDKRIYKLNLLPEHYLRPGKFEEVDENGLSDFRKSIEERLQQIYSVQGDEKVNA